MASYFRYLLAFWRSRHKRLARLERENIALRARLQASLVSETSQDGLNPENIVWIFGSGRTGSTWLMSMMGKLPSHAMWNEPLVGDLFGHYYYGRGSHRLEDETFILANTYRDAWLRSVRNCVLEGANARYPKMSKDDYLVIKEPHGPRGAQLLLEALPESRMIFLIRDPRDVALSALHAVRITSRRNSPHNERLQKQAKEQTDIFLRNRTKSYAQDIGYVERAYEGHDGRKALVRYEDLRNDTLGNMRRIHDELGIPLDDGSLSQVVEKYSWEKIPESSKGEGKGRYKGIAGRWRTELTSEQVALIEKETDWILDRFYSGLTRYSIIE